MNKNYKGKNYNPNYKGNKRNKNYKNSYKYKSPVKTIDIQESEITLYKKEIDTLINAIHHASSKNLQQRERLYDIYLDVLRTDDIVKSLIDKRFVDSIANKRVIVENDKGEEVEELKYFVESPKFRSFIQDILTTKLWGFRAYEFGNIEQNGKLWFDYSPVPMKHINPYDKMILKSQYSTEGKQFMDEKGNLKIKNIMWIGDEDSLGLLAQISLLSLYGKRAIFNYSKYMDLAGDGFTKLTSRNLTDDDHIDRLMKTFEKDKPKVMLLPPGDEVQTEQTSTSQQNQLFEGYTKMIEERLSKLILGVTQTTDDGSSYSQSLVHQEQQDDKFAGDIRYITDVLNYDFIEYLHIWGFRTDNIRFKFVPTSQEELKSKLEDYKQLMELGYVFTQEQLEEKFKELL